jgi:glycosyltransferase involved in cell wall biosynthesis
MDQPSIDGINTFLVCREAKKTGLKVALSGLGGDELLGGYSSFKQVPALVSLGKFVPFRRRLGGRSQEVAAKILPFLGSKYRSVLEYSRDICHAYFLRRAFYMPWELFAQFPAEFVRNGLERLDLFSRLKITTQGLEGDPYLAVAALEMTHYMRDRLLRDSDWASMAHSLELRVPFVDWSLFQRMAPLMANRWRRPRKEWLGLCLAPPLPVEVHTRRKTGFAVPMGAWLAGGTSQLPNVRTGYRRWSEIVYRRFEGAWPVRDGASGRPASTANKPCTPRPRAIRVALVANFEADGQASMQRYARLLREFLPHCRVHLLQPKALLSRLISSNSGIGKWLRYIDKFVLFPVPLFFAVSRSDVMHICDQGNAMYALLFRWKCKLATCHDALEIRSALGLLPRHVRWSGRVYQRLNLAGLRTCQRVICVSRATESDLIELALPPDRLETIENCLGHPFRQLPQQEARQILRRLPIECDKPFLLHVGSNAWYKNREGVLKIFAAIHRFGGANDLRLVFAGKCLSTDLEYTAKALGLWDRLCDIGPVDDSELNALYSTAKALLFPSLAEGFGWPILEAQACGCPVITSRCEPMQSIAGAASILVDPCDSDAAALTILGSLQKTRSIVEAGFLNVRRFGSEEFGRRYRNAYDVVLEQWDGRRGQSVSRISNMRGAETPRP